MIRVTGLFVYPVKSCRGVALDAAEVTDRGFRHDREWMVVDGAGRFLSQRTQPALARVTPRLGGGLLRLAADGMTDLELALDDDPGLPRTVSVWRDTCLACSAGPRAARWFSALLGVGCELVRMPGTTSRVVAADRPGAGGRVGFADAYPFLLLSAASLGELNRRLARPVAMDRFRPNIVVAGCAAHAEDGWAGLTVAGVDFTVAAPCARCVVVTTDQRTGERDPEPLRALASYRTVDGRVLFGVNLVHSGSGTLRVGDRCRVAAQGGASPDALPGAVDRSQERNQP